MPSVQKEFVFKDIKSAKAASLALQSELVNTYEKRAKTRILNNKNVVLLKIDATDEFALSASLYSYGRLLGLAKEISLI